MKNTTEISLVDDNPGDAHLIAGVLGQNHYPSNVHSVADGAEAMALLHRVGNYAGALPPHLLMLDVNMPCKDGFAVLAGVKADPSLGKAPITVFSASCGHRDIARSYDPGANNYVIKSVDLKRFVAAVASIAGLWFGIASVVGREDH
jgi:CheY-like chemotaxis protein